MIKKYSKEFDYSYIQGVFGVIEALKKKPEVIQEVFASCKLSQDLAEKVKQLCLNNKIPFLLDDRIITRVQDKENCFCVAIIMKKSFINKLSKNSDHIVLVNPMDMGNLGSIIRTMVGFNCYDLAIINPACDIFDPKVLRASMGAFFKINFQCFDNFLEYQRVYPRQYYPFMLEASLEIDKLKKVIRPHSLIFGNEGSGLDNQFLNLGEAIFIKHNDQIDSLNLASAVAIGIYKINSMKEED